MYILFFVLVISNVMVSLSVLLVLLSRVKCICVCVYIHPLYPGYPEPHVTKREFLGFVDNFNELFYLSSLQAFYPAEHPVDVSFGDVLAARCVFTGEGRTEATHIGYGFTDSII